MNGKRVQGTSLPNTDFKQYQIEIDLGELFRNWLDHIILILIVAILGASVAATYTFYFITPMYQATTMLYVVDSGEAAINLSDLQMGTYLAYDYVEVFKTWEVHDMVMKDLGFSDSYPHTLTVEYPNSTRILTITVTAPTATAAAAIANEYATVGTAYIAEKMATDKPNIMSVAQVPSGPSSPNIIRNIMVGFFLGLVGILTIFTIRFIMDDKIKTSEEVIKYTGMSVLAMVPEISQTEKRGKRGNTKSESSIF